MSTVPKTPHTCTKRQGHWEAWGGEDVHLWRSFLQHDNNYAVFRAYEPALVHRWHAKHCPAHLRYANAVSLGEGKRCTLSPSRPRWMFRTDLEGSPVCVRACTHGLRAGAFTLARNHTQTRTDTDTHKHI